MADVQSLKRAFDILRAVSDATDGASLSVISRQVALPKSTVARLLTTLENLGAVERLDTADGYRIGAEIITLAAQVAYPRNLVALARPALQALAQQSGETVSLGIPDGGLALTIDQIDSGHNFRLRNWVGERLPLHCSSDGKVYLAAWDDATLSAYLAQPLEAFSANTLTDPVALRAELAQIRAQGYAWNNREHDPDIVSIAAPIYDENQQIIAAICMFGPFFRFPPVEKQDEFIQLTLDAARQVTRRVQNLSKTNHRNG